MSVRDLGTQIRAELRELRAKREVIEAQEKALNDALAAITSPGAKVPTAGRRRRSVVALRRSTTEHVEAALQLINRNPGKVFTSTDLREAGIPGGSSTRVIRRLAEGGKVAVVGATPSGTPMVQAKAGRPEPAPEPEEEKIPEPGLPDEGKRQRVRRRPIRSMRETRMRIVNYLSQHGPTPQHEVAEALDLASSSMTMALRGMDGSVARDRTPNGDRPGWHYSLRLKGRGEGEREAVTKPGEGTEEGRLR